MKKMIMVVNSNVYETTPKIVDNTLKLVLDNCKKKKLNMIYALKKGNHIELIRNTYKNKKEMHDDYTAFVKQGFRVYRANFGVDTLE